MPKLIGNSEHNNDKYHVRCCAEKYFCHVSKAHPSATERSHFKQKINAYEAILGDIIRPKFTGHKRKNHACKFQSSCEKKSNRLIKKSNKN